MGRAKRKLFDIAHADDSLPSLVIIKSGQVRLCEERPPSGERAPLAGHSRWAFTFIQTIHLMNVQKSDTLAPPSKNPPTIPEAVATI
jgi:hypothetical protein